MITPTSGNSENVFPSANHDGAPNPWLNSRTLTEEIANQAEPVNYINLVGDNSVIMLGEGHFNSPIRENIALHAAEFKRAGITHYAIEAPNNPAFDELNSGNLVDLTTVTLGPVPDEHKSYERAVRAMADQGIKVVPVDIDQRAKPSKQEREIFLTDGIKKILAMDPDAKVAVLMGGHHSIRTVHDGSVPSMAARLIEEGMKVVAVQYLGGIERTPSHFLEATANAGIGQSDFMMDLRLYGKQQGVVFGTGNADYAIHLQQQASLPPDKLSLLGGATLGAGIRLTAGY